MDRKELNKRIDALKNDLNEAISESVRADREKTAANERKYARDELNDGLSHLENIPLGPEHTTEIGRLIVTIEILRARNEGRDWHESPPTREEVTKISEDRKITVAEAETLIHAIREMLKRIEAMKPAIMTEIMGRVTP